MGNFLSGFDTAGNLRGNHRLYEDYEIYANRPFLKEDSNYEDFSEYSNITATVFVIVMIILLLVLLICCVKTVLVCRRQKRVNDQRRRMMQRDNHNHEQSQNAGAILRAFTFDHHQHRIELPGSGAPAGVYVPQQVDYNDQPPAYDQVIGLPPSYDSIIILNGTVQSRATSVVGSVRNSVMDTVRSLRRGSRGSTLPTQETLSTLQTVPSGAVSAPSDIGSAKSESLVTSVSNALVVHRGQMDTQSDPCAAPVKRSKSMRKKSEEDEESLTN